jgi:hypothetical protein
MSYLCLATKSKRRSTNGPYVKCMSVTRCNITSWKTTSESSQHGLLREDPTSRQAATAYFAQPAPQRRSSRRAVVKNSDALANLPTPMRTRCLRGLTLTGRATRSLRPSSTSSRATTVSYTLLFSPYPPASMSARPPTGPFRTTMSPRP